MKNNFARIFFITTLVMSTAQLFAADPPPPPPIIPPVGLPIDSGLVVLFFIALVTGYFITQKIYKRKNS